MGETLIWTLAIVIFILIIIIYHFCHFAKYNKYINKSHNTISIADNNYSVLPYLENPEKAALLLAQVNKTNLALIDYILLKYHYNKDATVYKLALRLKNKYMPDNLRENDPTSPNDTSYTEDKGQVVALCLREKVNNNQDFEQFNLIVFVSIHELAHIASIGYGHEDEFWYNFKLLLAEAAVSGLYDPVDYEKKPVNYCGLDVTYNPLYDNTII